MGSMKWGSSPIINMYYGSSKVSAIYYGSSKVYPSATPASWSTFHVPNEESYGEAVLSNYTSSIKGAINTYLTEYFGSINLKISKNQAVYGEQAWLCMTYSTSALNDEITAGGWTLIGGYQHNTFVDKLDDGTFFNYINSHTNLLFVRTGGEGDTYTRVYYSN